MKNILMYFPFRQEIEVNLISEELKKFSNDIYMPKLLSNKKWYLIDLLRVKSNTE